MASTEQQIDDAVAKRHVQNTDTGLGVQSRYLDMNLHKVISLGDPTGDRDAAHKKYVDDHFSGGGDVDGPDSAIDSGVVLFDGITGKLIKDSARLIEDALTDGSNLPDGHAIKVYGDANWVDTGYTNLTEFVDQVAWKLFYSNSLGDVTELAFGSDGQYLKSNGVSAAPTWSSPGGGGDVIGPVVHAADYVPQWNGTPNSKTLVEGFAITVAGKALVDDADVAAQRTTLELLSAALRNAEDILTDGSNLPDGHAIKTYGDTNWGGGSSKWTDAGPYINPVAGTKYRILDAGVNLATITFAANTVYVLAPGATYNVSTSIIISNNYVGIIGNGATIRKTAQADGLRINGNHCRVVGVEIDGNSQGWAGLFVYGSYNVIDGVSSHNNGGHGIGQDGQSTTCQYNRIINCESFSNSGIGISLNDADYAIVSNNIAHNNSLEGYTCDANSPGWASGCMFDGNVSYNNVGGVGGFGIDRARNCTFSNNVIESSGSNDGMKTQNNQGPVEYCVFSGNVLANNGGYGINITTGAGGASHHNKLVGNVYRNNTSGDYYVISGQNNVVIEAAGGGSGDVVGPSSATANAITLFNGTTGKIIKNSARLIEDSLTDGSNLPDGHAIKTYGDANWGGGSSKWIDETTYIRPNNVVDSGKTAHRIYDTGYVMFGNLTTNDSIDAWHGNHSANGDILRIGQGTSGTPDSTSSNPPVWVQKWSSKDMTYTYDQFIGGGLFEIIKSAGKGTPNALVGNVRITGGTGGGIGMQGKVSTTVNTGYMLAGLWGATDTPSNITQSQACACELNMFENYNDKGELASWYTTGSTMGLFINNYTNKAGTGHHPNSFGIAMVASELPNHTSYYGYHVGILLETCKDKALYIKDHPDYGMYFDGVCDIAHMRCNSGDLTFSDSITGSKTLAQLAAGGGSSLWTDRGTYIDSDNAVGKFKIHDDGHITTHDWAVHAGATRNSMILNGQGAPTNVTYYYDVVLGAGRHFQHCIEACADTVSGSGDSLTSYVSMLATTGPGAIWTFNPLLEVKGNWSGPSAVCAEFDINMLTNTGGSGGQYINGICVTGYSYHTCGCAIGCGMMNVGNWRQAIAAQNFTAGLWMDQASTSSNNIVQIQHGAQDRWVLTHWGNVIMENTRQLLYWNAAYSAYIVAAQVDAANDIILGQWGNHVNLGYGCSQSDPVMIRVGGANSKQIQRSPDVDSQGRHYLTVT